MPTRLLSPGYQEFDANGKPAPGALLYTYEAGTSTPKGTYSDAGLTIPNANPVEADAGGRFGPVFAEAGDYRLIMKTAAEVTLWTADPVDGAAGSSVTPGAGIRNVLINGDFSVKQRSATTVADRAYGLDRWYVLAQSADIGVDQQTDQANGIPTSIRLTQSDVTSQRFGIAQVVEAANCKFLRASTAVYSFMARSSVSAAIRYAILSSTGTEDLFPTDVVNDWNSSSYTAGGFFKSSNLIVHAVGSVTPQASIWTTASDLTADISASASNVIVFMWTEEAQAQNVTVDFAKAQFEQGQESTAFEYLPYEMSLAACQRYYWITDQNLTIGGSMLNGIGASTWGEIWFPVTMRIAPAASPTFGDGVGNASQDLINIGLNGCQIQLTASGAGDGAFSVTLVSGCAFDAEINNYDPE